MTNEIYNEIIAEKESGNYPELEELNSTSKVAVWRLFIWIFAYISNTMRELWADFRTNMETFFATQQPGTLLWWIDQIKKFQFGDSLEFISNRYQYTVIDNEKQIVSQVALQRSGMFTQFKVAKTIEGELQALIESEITALTTYINQIKFPGTYIQVISAPSDTLKLSYKIYYNGLLAQSDVEENITNSINNYLQNIVFNGKFSITALTDELQKTTGVIDPIFVSAFGKNFSQGIEEYQPITDYYSSLAGYMSIDQLELEMIPENV